MKLWKTSILAILLFLFLMPSGTKASRVASTQWGQFILQQKIDGGRKRTLSSVTQTGKIRKLLILKRRDTGEGPWFLLRTP